MKLYVIENNHYDWKSKNSKEILKMFSNKYNLEFPSYLNSGKPILIQGYISISHSNEFLLIAYSDNPIGIDCSFLLKENLDDISKNINLKIACALHYAIKISYKIDTQIKWPNDLILSSRKCAGILIETQVSLNKIQAIIVGFGINIYKQEFENELKQSAIALEDFNNQTYDCNLFLSNLFNHLDDFLYTKNTIEYIKKHMIPIGSYVSISRNNTKEIVKIIDLNSEGQLIIERNNGEILTLFNEEISV